MPLGATACGLHFRVDNGLIFGSTAHAACMEGRVASPVMMQNVLAKLRITPDVQVHPSGTDPDWFVISSSRMSNQQLFQQLKSRWSMIVGPEPWRYALIHCKTGEDAGVWLHILPPPEYEPGCHEVSYF
jgi:hypothetical protein